MNPLFLLGGTILPNVLDLLVGDRASAATKAVVEAVANATGSTDPVKAQQSIAANPTMAAELRVELSRIVADEKKAQLEAERLRRRDEIEAEAQLRKDALERDVAHHKVRLDEIAVSQAEAREQREHDARNTERSGRMMSELINKDAYIARTPMALSYMVTAGFFIVLGLFVLMKSRLEAPQPAQFPKETLDILNTLRSDQIAALVQPRSDFVIQIINICIGALAAAFATVMSFWLGSSQSSRSKDALVADLQERSANSQERQAKDNVEIVKEVTKTMTQGTPGAGNVDGRGPVVVDTRASPGGTSSTVPSGTTQPADPAPEPVIPAAAGLLAEIMPKLIQPHRHFPDSASWALTPAGIAIDGARAQGTPGEPATVRRIWTTFGAQCAASAKKYGVPVELIVATIATESSGNPNARRAEPQIGDESVGLMQTLVKTARSATGRTSLRGDDLLDPAVSIDAGTAYIASQRNQNLFDAPRVGAAYNAGSLKRDDSAANRWKLHCFPRGTGQHIDRFVSWFNDAIQVSDAEDWGKAQGCPSFAQAFGGMEPSPATLDISSPDFPPRPAFRPILSLEDRQTLFGAFQFIHEPVADNPENIRIRGDWEAKNIVNVSIPLKSFLGKPGPLSMRFHSKAKNQLIELWLAWEKAGLLDRILTFDGAFVPRFQRKSTTKLSNHAFGSAFDINAQWNGLGAEPGSIGEKGCVRELVTIANGHGFYWGGHFNLRPDGMHFEVAKLL